MNEKIKSTAYLRVSGRGQIEKGGFDRQTKAIEKFCKSNGYEITKTYQEQVSGTKNENDRPIFMEMLFDLSETESKIVIVESLDRLARQYMIQEQLLIFLAAKGISLISASTGENVTEAMLGDPEKRLRVQMMGIFSEYEKNKIVQRLRKGREKRKRETGKCEGMLKYGSTPEQYEILVRISYLRRLSKNQKRRTSYQKVADILNEEGFLTRTGKKWTKELVLHVHQGGKK